jgi:hypothetical protein
MTAATPSKTASPAGNNAKSLPFRYQFAAGAVAGISEVSSFIGMKLKL